MFSAMKNDHPPTAHRMTEGGSAAADVAIARLPMQRAELSRDVGCLLLSIARASIVMEMFWLE